MQESNWYLVCFHCPGDTHPHIDATGLATWLQVIMRIKLWTVIVRTVQPTHYHLYTRCWSTDTKDLSSLRTVTVLLKPGDIL